MAGINLYGGNAVENLLDILLQKEEAYRKEADAIDPETIGNIRDKENLYISKKLFNKVSKYLERVPQAIRCSEIYEKGWFNKKESYIRKRLKHNRKEGIYQLGISNLYRSYNGKRVSRYHLYWLYDRDIYYINKELPLEPTGETISFDALPYFYRILNIDIDEHDRKG